MSRDEIRDIIYPAFESLSDETEDSVDYIFSEFDAKLKKFVDMGLSEEDAAKTAIGVIKSGYRKIKKLNLILFEGCFIGSTESKDANDYNRKQCQSLLDEFIEDLIAETENKDVNWKPHAFKAGLIDASGEVIYSQLYIDTFRQGNPNLKWMIGKTLDVNMRKNAYGMFRAFDSEDEFVFYPCYINAPDEFVPEFNKLYKFRAAIKGAATKNLTLYSDVSKLTELGTYDMDFIEEL